MKHRKTSKASAALGALLLAGCASVDVPSSGSMQSTYTPMATPLGITVQPVDSFAVNGVSMLRFRNTYAYADAEGMTLYARENDCGENCGEDWLAYIAPSDAAAQGRWSVTTRSDGQRQWALDGKPLYRYDGDEAVGQTKGDDANDSPWQAALFEPAAHIELPASMHVAEVPDAVGQALFNEENRVLYAYTGDIARETPQCGAIPCRWIPVAAPQLAVPVGEFTIVIRPDQTRQWAYQGRPLFTYSGDYESGYAAGLGVDQKMDVAVLIEYFMPSNAMLQRTPGQGFVLADENGMTLYRRDTWAFQQGGHGIRRGVPPRPQVGRQIGTSMEGCDAECQSVWHPFAASDDAQASGFWQIATREDGTRQWVYKGYALYTYAGDQRPADLRGTDHYDFFISLDPEKETKYPAPTFGMGALAWLYAFP